MPAAPAGDRTGRPWGAGRGAAPLVGNRARRLPSRRWLVRGEFRLGVEPEETAQDVAEGPVVLVGHSYGGTVVTRAIPGGSHAISVSRPDEVAATVLAAVEAVTSIPA